MIDESFVKAFEAAGCQLTDALLERLPSLDGPGRADPIVSLARQAEAEQQRWAAEAKDAAAVGKVYAAMAEALKGHVFACMEATGERRVEGPRYVCQIVASPPKVRWEGEGDPPEGFRRVKIELDARRAEQAWKDGKLLPDGLTVTCGAHLRIDG